jgi:hypothetical protein
MTDGQDTTKSPLHPAVSNQDKHVDNLQKSVTAKRTMSRMDSIENASAQTVQRLKYNQMKSRTAVDKGVRNKGNN